ncbi:MAG: helix-turn-helix domain-containing protein [Acidobacteriales bacterium]|nr:helix-turn-helix domain-containing protein [Terriglobales bacterium]
MTESVRWRMLTLAMTKTLGQRIRELRDQQDVSLREFAKKINATPAHLSDIELGRRYPSDALLKRIADVFKLDMSDLQKYDSRPPVEEIKRLSESDPTYGFAFRKMIEQNISPGDILKGIARGKSDRES